MISVRAPGDSAEHDVLVEAPPQTTVDTLAEVLAKAFDVRGRPVHLEIDGAAAAGDALIGSIAVGSVVSLVEGTSDPRSTSVTTSPSAAPDVAVAELVVASGPEAGRAIPLRLGRHDLGRGRDAAIRISDDEVSRRHAEVQVAADEVEVRDAGSANGTFVNGRRLGAGESVVLRPSDALEVGRTALRLQERTSSAAGSRHRREVVDGRIPFNRPPRVRPPDIGATIRLGAPPEESARSRLPIASSLAPLLLGVAMALMMRQPAYLLFAIASPFMAAFSFFEERRGGSRSYGERRRAYEQTVDQALERLREAHDEEVVTRRRLGPDVAEIRRRARDLTPDLWERRPGDVDYLHLRVAWADQPAKTTLRVDPGGTEELRAKVEAAAAPYAVASAAPVVVDLKAAGAAAVVAGAHHIGGTARWLVAQAAVLHSPRDVEITIAVTPDAAHEWEWARWLPHVQSEAAATDVEARFATSLDAATTQLASLAATIDERERERHASARQATGARPDILALVDGRLAIPRHLVTPLLERGPDVGVHVVWLAASATAVPGECGAVVEVGGAPLTAGVSFPAAGDEIAGATPDELSQEVAAEIARSLAPVRDLTAAGGQAIPTRVGLTDVLGLGDVTAAAIGALWDVSPFGADAPIGIGAAGTARIDLRHDGPHALVGGTTGAGKSELLQTMVAALAASHPPDRLTFLLVDYKGGAAFKDCVALPHTVGYVTDLDGHLVHRALVSLDAELRRREHLLASAGAKDLLEMERRDPAGAPPALVLVVDEFAALAKELPEFVDGVVNVAQRGRSLGIHLVLATQRPAGAINDNIRANTNLRIALRMNDAADSDDVIGARDAARLPRTLPGRAYVRTGEGELAEVQVAYAGATEAAGSESIVVRDAATGAVRAHATAGTNDPASETDLQRIVAAISGAARERAIPPPVRPWVPPLPSVIPLTDLAAPDDAAIAVIGMVDEPAQQRQVVASFDTANSGSLLVYGAGGAGKTTLLRTLAVSLAERSTPDALHLYALDYASRGLTPLAQLPHCGAVIASDDGERTYRLFDLLDREVEQRRQRFAAVGATSLAEHNATAPQALPRIVVLLDGYGTFAAIFDKVDYGELLERVPRLVTDGRALGLAFVISADRRGSVPYSLSGAVPTTIVLRQADSDDYTLLGVDGRALKGVVLPPGRGFLDGDREVQIAVPGTDAAGDAQIEAVAAIGRRLGDVHTARAPQLTKLPDDVSLAGLVGRNGAASGSDTPVVGIAGDDLSPVAIDLREGHLLVTSPARGGKSTALVTIARAIAAAGGAELVVFAPRRSPLHELTVAARTATSAHAADELAAALAEEMAGRDPHSQPLVILVDDAHLLADSDADASLATIAKRGRDVSIVIVAAAEPTEAERAYGGVITEVRRDRHGLLLMPDLDTDGDLVNVRLPRRSTVAMVPGRGYLVERGIARLTQIAR